MTDTIEKDATEYAEAEYAKLDDPARSDIELWERFLGIDSPEVRALFDERLVLKRGGIDTEDIWQDMRMYATPDDASTAHKAMYAEHAAEMRNPAPTTHVHADPVIEANDAKLMAMLVDELYTRAALKKWLYKTRRDALRAEQQGECFEREREARQQTVKRVNLATPIVLEGELLPRAY